MNQAVNLLSLQMNPQFHPISQSQLMYSDETSAASMAHLATPMVPEGQIRAAASGASMGASQSAKFSSLLSKKASRMKEILLQNIGKANKTTDSLFTIYEENFHKQQAQAIKLQKEFKVYLKAFKGATEAERNLSRCIQQVTGDYQPARHDLVCENLSSLERICEELNDKLKGQILVNLGDLMGEFHDLKDKIAKRKRKQIDFDSSKRIYELTMTEVSKKRLEVQRQQLEPQTQQQQSNRDSGSRLSIGLKSSLLFGGSIGAEASESPLESATSQLIDEARLIKLREQYNYSKIMYETINAELCDELPLLYERKMKFLLMTLQNYFNLRAQFHSKSGQLLSSISEVIDELPKSIVTNAISSSVSPQETNQATSRCKTFQAASSSSGLESSGNSSGGNSSPDISGSGSGDESPVETNQDTYAEVVDDSGDVNRDQTQFEVSKELKSETTSRDIQEGSTDERMTSDELSASGASEVHEISLDTPEEGKKVDDQSENADETDTIASSSESEENLEGKTKEDMKEQTVCLYKVKTNYKYLAEDLDELCFEADEIIQVIEFDESQEPEDGWLMGVREVNGQKGLFPANFTKPI